MNFASHHGCSLLVESIFEDLVVDLLKLTGAHGYLGDLLQGFFFSHPIGGRDPPSASAHSCIPRLNAA